MSAWFEMLFSMILSLQLCADRVQETAAHFRFVTGRLEKWYLKLLGQAFFYVVPICDTRFI